ncbi:uncharacterized protein BO80DRAFT_423903 [Aspergillus ibericus CBS 121593]|uniref:Mid2 domain-containing protein n=1 Tax=Aspergillus ibericus CBS 121593 TaxID=1448316 RepID=A0A395H4B6_9EURO|nr:hypothetical protein BO80DRAFT_423903 [Aspergillus ibericus CBS 121593]RAL02480.1 hypothetical protein BO80DRAFT_423903 [Aspergillus ibericus CBS 121593]
MMRLSLLFSTWLALWTGCRGEATLNTSIQDSPHFMGWYLGTTTQALTDGGTWSTSGQYAAGCTASMTCSWATACNDGILYYNIENKTLDCAADSMQCQTMTIYQSEPYATPSASNLFCANFWSANTIYRELPATTTSSATSGSTPSVTTASITSAPSSTQTATASPSATSSPSAKKSRAWIAGAVIGAVAGVVAIIAATIFFLRHRITRRPEAIQYENVSVRPVSELPSDTSTEMAHELPHNNPAPASRGGVYELS